MTFSMKSERPRLRVGFQRFSNASVDIGFPLMPAPQRAREMRWIDLESIRQLKNFPLQAVVKLRRTRLRVPWQIGPTYSAHEEVSPVSRNHGSGPRVLSVMSRQMLSGVWPGV